MAFLSDIKNELCATLPKSACCRKSLLLGILVSRGEMCDGKVHLRIADGQVLSLAVHLVKEQLGRDAQELPRAHGGRVRTLCFQSTTAKDFLLSLEEELDKARFLRCPSCSHAFLRGLFLAGGYVTNPTKAYRLELSLGARAEIISGFLSRELDLSGKLSNRREETLLYFKDSTAIEEMMTMLGLSGATFHLMNSKIEKQFRNEANRRANCEAGNINRSVEAASRITAILRRLEREKLLSSLPDELEDAAKIRLEHPEASLSQLAAMMTPPITKSGLNHRLRKITEYAALLGVTDSK